MSRKNRKSPKSKSSCQKCNAEFIPRRYEQKYCSDRCRWNSISPEKRKAKRKRWLKRNGKKYVQEYNKKNKRKLLELNYSWRKKNPEASKLTARKTLLKRTYGITLEQYEEILQKQDYRCAVCKRHRDEFTKNLAVDHDHKTGEIRGALCTHCNRTIIGRNRDAEIFMNAYKYLLGPFTGWIAPKQKRKKKKK